MYKIYIELVNQDLTYTLEQPIIAGNKNVYEVLLSKDSVKEWDNIIGNDGIREIVFYNNISQISNGTVFRNDEESEYYICRIPDDVIRDKGKLLFTIHFANSTTSYYSNKLKLPIDIFSPGTTSINIMPSEYTGLTGVLTNLIGGKAGQYLQKGSDYSYDFNWVDQVIAESADHLSIPREIELTNGAIGHGTFDGSSNVSIPVTKIDFDSAKLIGTIGIENLPESISSGFIYAGNINAATGIVRLSNEAKTILNIAEDTTYEGNIRNSDVNTDGFICAVMYPGSAIVGSGNVVLELKAGDRIIMSNNEWDVVPNDGSVTAVGGSATGVGKTGVVILSNEDVEAAKGNPEHEYSALAADKLYNKQDINGVKFDGSVSISNYALCSSTANSDIKQVVIDNYVEKAGSIAFVRFVNTNTASECKLQINTNTPKDIKIGNKLVGVGEVIPSVLRAGYTYMFLFDGTAYSMLSGIDSAYTSATTVRQIINTKAQTVLIPEQITAIPGYEKALMIFIEGILLREGVNEDYILDKVEKSITFNTIPSDTQEIDFVCCAMTRQPTPTINSLVDDSELFPIARAQTANRIHDAINLIVTSHSGQNADDESYTYINPNFDASKDYEIRLPGKIEANITGNAASATKLQTARKIGNAAFDGTANISSRNISGITEYKFNNVITDQKINDAWSGNTYIMTGVNGVTSSNLVIIMPQKGQAVYNKLGIYADSQSTNTITFKRSYNTKTIDQDNTLITDNEISVNIIVI